VKDPVCGMEVGSSFDQAVESVRKSTVFTTHTPVPAGHDVFPAGLVEKYLAGYRTALGLDRERVLALGEHGESGRGVFNMTALALRLSGRANAVSHRHGQVSRRLWRGLWPGIPEDRVPIASVTNGVHVPSWVAPEIEQLYRAFLGERWRDRHDDMALWDGVARIPDRTLWDAHQALKRRLLRFLQARARHRWSHNGGTPVQVMAAGALLDPDTLTLGFARRFATYKRASLLFRDPERLRAIVTDARRPVQIIFAGKAHPADEPAKRVLQEVYRAAMAPAYEGRVAFVEDYDMQVARHLVQGVDLWVNTPQPPLEASGTSGMKAALNGIPNLSVADGWWLEAYDGTNGWVLGASEGDGGGATRDAADAQDLYRLLEADVVPRFYERDTDGFPTRWIPVMRPAIQTVAPRFSARRMLKEYMAQLYGPALAGVRRG